MTNPDYTHVTMVIDRSGSMQGMRPEAQDGINLILREQFLEEGKVTFTLVDFDDEIATVERMRGSQFEYSLEPRGSTALLDAVGLEIEKTGFDLAQLPEDERPGRVLFVIVTDGGENASRNHTFEGVSSLIARQTNDYKWQFQYVGPAAEAWQGERMGAKTSRFSGRRKGMSASYREMNESIKTFRKSAPETDFFMAEIIDDDL